MDTLFTDIENTKRAANAPLAVRMRPQTLDDLIAVSYTHLRAHET